MVTIYLKGEDAIVLREVLEMEVSDLRMEIAGTDLLEFRRSLKDRKEALIRVVDSLASQLI